MAKELIVAVAVALLAGCAPADLESSGTPGQAAYWEVPAFEDRPPAGPEIAKGVIFWNHGVSGKNVQWKSPPARFLRRFADAGWDVIKVNRNNLNENGWIASGVKHVDHVIRLAKKAKADGYRYVIAGGQSYGGAIALEAGAEKDLFYGVIAAAPGHGSDACGSAAGTNRVADTLTRQLVEAIERVKTPRIVLTMAKDDECMGFNEPAAQLRKALLHSASRFVFLDDTMPIHGHFAAHHRQFARWYGRCLVRFFDPETEPGADENFCKAPNPVPRYLLPAGYRAPVPPADERSLVGAWSGQYDLNRGSRVDTRDICLIIEVDLQDGLKAKMAYGAGRRLTLNMGTRGRTFRKSGAAYTYAGRNFFRIRLTPSSDYTKIGLHLTSTNGNDEWSTTLKRGCRFYR